ncbi:hypothetical protein ACFL0V_03000 [Nanoarchaeota archaeon]
MSNDNGMDRRGFLAWALAGVAAAAVPGCSKTASGGMGDDATGIAKEVIACFGEGHSSVTTLATGETVDATDPIGPTGTGILDVEYFLDTGNHQYEFTFNNFDNETIDATYLIRDKQERVVGEGTLHLDVGESADIHELGNGSAYLPMGLISLMVKSVDHYDMDDYWESIDQDPIDPNDRTLIYRDENQETRYVRTDTCLRMEARYIGDQ